jgi:hypothetical protein
VITDQHLYFLVAANIVAWAILFLAIFYPRLARLSFFLLFAWACWVNWMTSQQTPGAYLEYAGLSVFPGYRSFIRGWFSRNIELTVGIIASCQGLIAIAMWTRGILFQLAAIGATVFLLAIIPLGIGSGFPATLVMAAAMLWLVIKHPGVLIWDYTSLIKNAPKMTDSVKAHKSI